MTGTTETVVVRSLQAFVALAAEWDALAAAHRQPLVEHDWYLSCAETLHAEAELRIVLVREGGALIAAAPLAAHREGGIERLEILGMRVLHEPSGLLYRDEAALRTLIRAVTALRRPLMLQRVDRGGPIERVARETVGWRGCVLAHDTGPTVRLPLAESWPEVLARVSGRMRKWLRRAGMLAAAEGPVRVEHVSPGLDDVAAHLERFAALEAAGWKGRNRSALGTRSSLGTFFAAYVRRAAARGTLRFCFLHVGTTLAAAQIAIDAHGSRWVLKIAYDETLARLSPGLQLTAVALEDAVQRGLAACEFIGSADEWKQRWHGELRDLRLVLVYPGSARGVAAFGVDAVVRAGRAATRRLAARRRAGASDAVVES
jgi:CelD/BcsL family acetyltransferase involved in cellulose biosynthesis